ncbi:unnamed protein product [Symbiodinium sp. KB8]|nr:unnamed protein product [Symbiodinium sp. KB8]
MEQELQTTSSELPDSELVMGSLQVLHDAGCLTEKSFSGKPMGKLSRCRMDAGYLKRAKMSKSLAKSGGKESSVEM